MSLERIILQQGECFIHLPSTNQRNVYPLLFLLHGWSGDETKMWVFVRRLKPHFIIVALRGLFPTPQGGYGWYDIHAGGFPYTNVFSIPINTILGIIQSLKNHALLSNANFSSLHWMGFSQGAAVVFMLGLLHPQFTHSIIGFAGYLPNGALQLCNNKPLIGRPVFVSYGTQDQIIPISRSRQTIQLLQQAGADLTICESNTGHQISLDCIKQMELFLHKQIQFNSLNLPIQKEE